MFVRRLSIQRDFVYTAEQSLFNQSNKVSKVQLQRSVSSEEGMLP